MKKVSIIVPIYNVEKYIDRCFETLVNQTYNNYEIIAVNDGSKDSSISKIKKYCDKYSNIKLLNKENGGLSSARNFGLKHVEGEYVMFVDSDDWLDLDAIERCMEKVNENDYDLVLFPYKKEFDNNSIKVSFFGQSMEFNEKEYLNKIYRRFFGLYENELLNPDKLDELSTAWGKLYKYELIRNTEFTDTKIIGTEDVWYNINALKNVKKAYYIDDVYYHYYKDNNGSLTRNYKPKLFEQWSTLYSYMKNYIKENNLDRVNTEALNNRICLNELLLTLNIVNSKLSFINKYKEIKKLLNQKVYDDKYNNFEFKYFDIKWKLFYKSCKNKNTIMVYMMTVVAEKVKRFRK